MFAGFGSDTINYGSWSDSGSDQIRIRLQIRNTVKQIMVLITSICILIFRENTATVFGMVRTGNWRFFHLKNTINAGAEHFYSTQFTDLDSDLTSAKRFRSSGSPTQP